MNEIDAERRLACAALMEAALCPDEDDLDDVGPPPCRGCPLFDFCANEPAACADYAHWVEEGEIREGARTPTRDLFDFVFGLAPFGEDLAPQLRPVMLGALAIEAERPVLATILFDHEEDAGAIGDYARAMRRLGVVLGVAAVRALLSRWPGTIPGDAKLRWALSR